MFSHLMVKGGFPIPESDRLRREVSIEDAWDLLRGMLGPVKGVRLAVSRALDRVALEEVLARSDLPPRDTAGLDGYAVRASDPPEGRVFRVVGRISAGQIWDRAVGKGETVRVMTGCPLPADCDAVLPLETVQSLEEGLIRHEGPLRSGMNIIRAGEEMRCGRPLIRSGIRLGPEDLAVLASGGRRTVVVSRRPRVGVLVTGNELVLPGKKLPRGGRYSSNGVYLKALAKREGARVFLRDPVPDRMEVLREAVETLSDADLILVSGGSGKGDGDLVDVVLRDLGAQCVFRGMRIRPGHTTSLYLWRGKPVVALPGRPGGMRVGFEILARPAIHWLQGERKWRPPRLRGVLESSLERRRHVHQLREAFIRTGGGRFQVLPLSRDLRGRPLSQGQTQGWVEIPPGEGMVQKGEIVTVWLKGTGDFGGSGGIEEWDSSP